MNLVDRTDPVLWTPARDVEDITDEVVPFVGPLLHLMKEKRGISLAAPQAGIPLRFFVIEGKTHRNGVPLFLPRMVIINPIITWKSADVRTAFEGCLSFGNAGREVPRAESIRIDYTDIEGARTVGKLVSGFVARVWQHETDHLDGICIFTRPEVAA